MIDKGTNRVEYGIWDGGTDGVAGNSDSTRHRAAKHGWTDNWLCLDYGFYGRLEFGDHGYWLQVTTWLDLVRNA